MNFYLNNLVVISSIIFLTACFPDSGGGSNSGASHTKLGEFILDTGHVGAIAATTPDYATSDIVLFRNTAERELIVDSGSFQSSSETDISIAASGNRLYRLGRYQINNLSRYDVSQNLNTSLQWQYSVKDASDASANPYTVVERSSSRAYVVKYDLPEVWVIDPETTSEEDFKISELDLSAYSAYECSGGTPNANDAVILDNKLFVLMERLGGGSPGNCDTYSATENSYIAVFNLNGSDAEINTGAGDSLKGIKLAVKNAGNLSAYDGLIYVSGRATGKIETVNPNTYATNVLSITGGSFSSITQVEIADDNHGYFVDGSWQNYSLYHFNPSDLGEAAVAVTGLTGTSIADIKAVELTEPSAAYLSLLYVAVQGADHGRIDVVNVLDQGVLESFDLEFNPTALEILEL